MTTYPSLCKALSAGEPGCLQPRLRSPSRPSPSQPPPSIWAFWSGHCWFPHLQDSSVPLSSLSHVGSHSFFSLPSFFLISPPFSPSLCFSLDPESLNSPLSLSPSSSPTLGCSRITWRWLEWVCCTGASGSLWGLPGLQRGEPRVCRPPEPPVRWCVVRKASNGSCRGMGPRGCLSSFTPTTCLRPVPLWLLSQGPCTLTECSLHAQHHP